MSELAEFLGSPKTKRIWDWNRHCYTTVTAYEPASHRTQAAPQPLPRTPLPIADRLYLFLKWYGCATVKYLAQILCGSTANKNISRVMQALERDERFVIVGERQTRGGKRPLWGINDA